MIYNFKSEKEAEEFIDKIADPYKLVAWTRKYLEIDLPDPGEMKESHDDGKDVYYD